MGKKRRRGYGAPGGFWTQEVGGAPYWFIGLAVIAMFGIGTYALVAAPATPTAASTPRPIPTFTYSDRTPTPEKPTALFIGDSYTAGAGGGGTRWTTIVSAELGWVENNQGRGGTGYVSTSNEEGCGLAYCPTFVEMVDEIEADPSIVVISGGRNDANKAGLAEAAVAVIEAVQAKWPAARVIVTSPLWDDDPQPLWFPTMATTIEEAATSRGAEYLALGQPIEGDSALVDADGVHPNSAGYEAIAAAFLTAAGS